MMNILVKMSLPTVSDEASSMSLGAAQTLKYCSTTALISLTITACWIIWKNMFETAKSTKDVPWVQSFKVQNLTKVKFSV